MHYKKYRRPTVREALRAIREELGPDALVLSTRMVRARGINGWMGARVVEVTAADPRPDMSDERLDASLRRHDPERTLGQDRDQEFAQDLGDALAPLPRHAAIGSASGHASRQGTGDFLRQRSKQLLGLARKAATHPPEALTAHARNLAARLEATGLDAALAASVARHPGVQTRAAGAYAMRNAMADLLRPLTAPVDDLAPVEVFVGPPGVGKTTTIAKIAAQARAATDRRVWLVAADGFRVGAVEQLRLYAEIIGSPFIVARSGAELSTTLDGLRRPLLVDTAGRSPRDAGNADILEALEGRANVRRHLVLSADTGPAQARAILERFKASQPDRLILTRLDETKTIAPLVGVLSEFKVPLSYLAHGQNVPEDLERATTAVLTDWVLGETTSGACA